MAIMLEEGVGGMAFNGLAISEETFFSSSKTKT